MEKNNPKVLHAWCMYDWANSVYTLTIATAVFPIYFSAVTTKPDGSDLIPFLWMEKRSAVVYTYSLSIAFLLISFLSPLLSGVADYTGAKKRFMKAFVYIGSFSCMGLFFFDASHISIGIFFFITAGIGYAGSLVFYNAFLPEIATPDKFDKLSVRGYSLGYIGSVILLILNLLTILQPAWFGLEPGTLPARIAFVTVGIWWLGFSYYSFAFLPNATPMQIPHSRLLLKGFYELKKVYGEVQENAFLKRFLSAFFFYSMGLQTIMYLAGIFGEKELKLPEASLISVLLLIQLVAVGGATLFLYLVRIAGNLITLSIGIAICMVVCLAAYYVNSAYQFYALAVVVGIIMGGMQSLSRSTYTKLLPEVGNHASYYSFYEFTEKVGIVIGTAVYAFITDYSGNMRNSIFALIAFFIVGFFFLINMVLSRKQAIRATQATYIS